MKYKVRLQKCGNSIIGFNITYKGYCRNYPMYECGELEIVEHFISRKITEFLNEVKDYKEYPLYNKYLAKFGIRREYPYKI